MNTYFLVIGFIVLVAVSVVSAQSPGCGPTPMIPNQQFNQPIQQQQSQAAQQAKQIQQIQATADFQAATARIQTQMRISQIQNQGSNNPQLQQQTMKSYQDQLQLLQTNFQQTMQQLNQQR